jgi:hypothetical protein
MYSNRLKFIVIEVEREREGGRNVREFEVDKFD